MRQTVPQPCHRLRIFRPAGFLPTAKNGAGGPVGWIILFLAGLFEIVWAVALKYWGFDKLLPSAGILAAMAASAGLLRFALRTLPVGTAYAIWTGIGVAGTTTLGLYLFDEPATPLRLACIGLILLGMVGLKLAS